MKLPSTITLASLQDLLKVNQKTLCILETFFLLIGRKHLLGIAYQIPSLSHRKIQLS